MHAPLERQPPVGFRLTRWFRQADQFPPLQPIQIAAVQFIDEQCGQLRQFFLMIGRTAEEICQNPDKCPVIRAFETGKKEQQITRMTNWYGKEVVVHHIAGPVLGPTGKIEQVIEIIVDVSAEAQDADNPVPAQLRN